jgi:acyl-CoA thioesterase FadM
MNEQFIVRTWIESFNEKSVDIRFEMLKGSSGKVAAEGASTYVLIDARSGKPAAIPEDIKEKFSI